MSTRHVRLAPSVMLGRKPTALEYSGERSNDDELLSVKEASAFLRMSAKWLYQSCIPFVRIGRRRLYFRADLLDYAKQRMSNAHLERNR